MPRIRTVKIKVALKMTPMTILQLIEFSNHVVLSMTGNSNFALPVPSLAAVSNAIASVEAAVADAHRGSATATSDKLAKRKLLQDLMTSLGAYVESVANLDPPNAITIIRSAGMEVKQALPPKPNGFRLKLTGKPGEVLLMTTRVRSSAYKWEYTTTPDVDSSWLVYVENMNREILLKGLQSGLRYYFRVAVIQDKAGPWSQVISTIVL